jgi:hypothetical protein
MIAAAVERGRPLIRRQQHPGRSKKKVAVGGNLEQPLASNHCARAS